MSKDELLKHYRHEIKHAFTNQDYYKALRYTMAVFRLTSPKSSAALDTLRSFFESNAGEAIASIHDLELFKELMSIHGHKKVSKKLISQTIEVIRLHLETLIMIKISPELNNEMQKAVVKPYPELLNRIIHELKHITSKYTFSFLKKHKQQLLVV